MYVHVDMYMYISIENKTVCELNILETTLYQF